MSTLLYVTVSLSISSLLSSDSYCKTNNELGAFLSIDVIFFINKAEDCHKFLNGLY